MTLGSGGKYCISEIRGRPSGRFRRRPAQLSRQDHAPRTDRARFILHPDALLPSLWGIAQSKLSCRAGRCRRARPKPRSSSETAFRASFDFPGLAFSTRSRQEFRISLAAASRSASAAATKGFALKVPFAALNAGVHELGRWLSPAAISSYVRFCTNTQFAVSSRTARQLPSD